jgi:thiosulfate/3-mercaptopyruvate sulfurtransferase
MHDLISVDELAAALGTSARPLVLDVRWAPAGPSPLEQYRQGHLPTARQVDLGGDLAGPPGPDGRHPLPSAEAFTAAMRRLGVRAGRPIVAYDQRDATIAARLWWNLRYFGHDAVRVLDGGFEAWARAGLPVAVDDPEPVDRGDFVAVPGGMPTLTVSDVAAFTRTGVLLDSRLGERFRGETEPLDPVAGHIPGARSAPTFDNSDAAGCFRPVEQLRRRFADLGVDAGRPVAAYCGSGVTAAHQVLALRLAGFDAALYPGSWSEWCADPDRPIATGA